MSDAERLAAPAFVVREAGVSFGNDRYASDARRGVAAPFRYTEIVVGPDGVPVVLPDPTPAEPGHLRRRSAAGRSCACGDAPDPPSPSATPGRSGRTRPRLAGLVRLPMTEPNLVFLPWARRGGAARPARGPARRAPGQPGVGDRRGAASTAPARERVRSG